MRKKLLRITAALLALLLTFFAGTVHALDGVEISEEPAKAIGEEASEKGEGIDSLAVPGGVTAISTSENYGWSKYGQSTDVLISGNQYISNSVSSLKITVTGSGVLSYQYRVYSNSIKRKANSGDADEAFSETNPDSLVISVGREITASDSYSDDNVVAAIAGRRYYGYTGWQTGSIKIEAAEGETTDIWFAYKKNGSGDDNQDQALLKGITFNSGQATITANASDDTYGTVTGGGAYYAGEAVALTAEPKNGGKFYGWVRDGVYIDTAETLMSFIAGADTTVTAIFGSESETAAQNHTTGTIYTGLKAAVDAAASGDTVVLVNDTTLAESLIIPAGVTLYIPYSAEFDGDGNKDGTAADSSTCFAPEAKTFRRLTVNEGNTLTVKGKLLVGGVISYPSQMYQGHTSGPHGRITNNGHINVEESGEIHCYGFIDGAGKVEAVTGKVYEPFVVLDFAGGNNTLSLYNADQNPFMEYTMQNISCTLVIRDTAAYGVYCNLYADSKYNKTDAVLIGGSVTAPVAMIKLAEGASVKRTIDKTKSIPGGIATGEYGADIYRADYVITGGAALSNMQMKVYGFDVSVNQFPIPYCFTYTLTDGSYTMPKGWTIMPGTELTVAADASFDVAGSLYVPDGLVNTGMSGKYYPSSSQLMAKGFSSAGVLKVNGTMTLLSGSSFGGIVQTDGTGKITVQQNVTLQKSVQIGATGTYDDNTCVIPLSGRIRKDGALVALSCGTSYEAADGNAWTLEGFTVTSYAKTASAVQPGSGKWTKPGSGSYWIYGENESFTTNQSMCGSFKIAGQTQGFTVIQRTCYGDTDSSRTEVGPISVSGSTAAFTVTATEDGAAYNFRVQYSEDGGESVTITPDASGVYTITGITGNVTITVTSVKKGDVDLDGDITAADVTLLRRTLAGYQQFSTELNRLAADCDTDGDITAADVTKLRRVLAGYEKTF